MRHLHRPDIICPACCSVLDVTVYDAGELAEDDPGGWAVSCARACRYESEDTLPSPLPTLKAWADGSVAGAWSDVSSAFVRRVVEHATSQETENT